MRGIRIVIAWCFVATALLSFWNVVRFIPTKVYTDGSGSDPSIVAKALLISIFVAFGSLFTTAWWTVLRKRDSARKWALLASFVLAFAGFLLLYAHPITLIEKGWIPLAIGVTGLAVFYRGRTAEQQRYVSSGSVPSDGTNAIMDKLVVVLAVLAVFGGDTLWTRWADAHGLSQNLPPFFYVRFMLTVALVVVLHESGHLLAGLALGMKVIFVAIGPAEWSNSLGRRKLRIQAAFQSWFRGQTLVAPKYVQRFRERKILQVAAGPFVSIAHGNDCSNRSDDEFGQSLARVVANHVEVCDNLYRGRHLQPNPFQDRIERILRRSEAISADQRETVVQISSPDRNDLRLDGDTDSSQRFRSCHDRRGGGQHCKRPRRALHAFVRVISLFR